MLREEIVGGIRRGQCLVQYVLEPSGYLDEETDLLGCRIAAATHVVEALTLHLE